MAAVDRSDAWEAWDPWRASKLYYDWYKKTQVGETNDFVLAVSASSRTGVSGTGKTTLETHLGREFDTSPDGFDAKLKGTVDVRELAYERLPKIPDNSAVVGDEIQGAPGTEGLDARRGMRQSSIDAINSILANRDKSLTVILGAQIIQMLDKRLYPLLDAWLLIRKEPGDPDGPLVTYHKVHTDDYNLKSQDWKTPAVEDLTWPRIPHDDPDYKHLNKLKQKAKDRDGDDDGQPPSEEPKHIRNRRIKSLVKEGVPQNVIAETYGVTQSRVSQIANNETD